jgi:hypothetical protein
MRDDGDVFVDRGDAAAWDKQVGDFTTDGTWNDLDLSAVVPAAGAGRLVLLHVEVEDDAAESAFSVREKGNANAFNVGSVITQVANVLTSGDLWVLADGTRTIQYFGTNLAFVTIDLYVRGWMEPGR